MEKIKVNKLFEGAVIQFILDDGKGNILDHEMMEQLQAGFDALKTNNEVKLILIEGAGKHFSFGASVEEHRKEFAAAMLHHFHQLFFTLRDLSIPAVAKISGQCLGGGLELALACDILFADKTAKLGQPEINLGVFPPPASILLPLKLGYARAEELLITGRSITAEEGRQLGLLNNVYEDKNEMDQKTLAWIEQYILPKSASSLRYAVKAARIKYNHILGNFLPQLENLYVNQLMNTHDANEGINSFLEKRKPTWTNN